VRLVTLGVGAQNSPRYAPAGLLVTHGGVRVMIDGGPGAVPSVGLDAWLVTDMRGELIAAIRTLARARGLRPYAGPFQRGDLHITARAVVHTSHPTCGYRIEAAGLRVVWAPEFYEFPRWREVRTSCSRRRRPGIARSASPVVSVGTSTSRPSPGRRGATVCSG
jgi:hypothetical protein